MNTHTQMSPPSSHDPDFYTRSEAAERLRMSLATFDRRVKEERTPVTKRPVRGARVFLSREQMFIALERRRRGEI